MSSPVGHIRRATADDAPLIKALVRAEPLDPNAIDWRYFHVLEIEHEGQPTIAAIGMLRPEGDLYEIDSITTRPAFRRRGFAAAIVRALLALGLRPVYLLAESDLVAYYARLGFAVVPPDAAPIVMRDQAEFVNGLFRGQRQYHIMRYQSDPA